MPDAIKKIVQDRLKETANDRQTAFDPSDMYLDDLKKNFGSVMMDSRNAANRSNKPIASQLAKGGNAQRIRILKHDDDDDDYEDEDDDDDDILGGRGSSATASAENTTTDNGDLR